MQSERRTSRRWLRTMMVGAGVVALFGGGWMVAGAVQSPTQREAAATAPRSKPVTAEVTRGDLSRSITAEVSIQRQDRQKLMIASTDDIAVITKQSVAVGDEILAGRPVAEINGRPVLAFPGAFPFYRNLTQGDSGPDVHQLQAGLTAAGFPVAADGRFGESTVRAVRLLYAEVGYTVRLSDPIPLDDAEDASHKMAEATPDLPAPDERLVMVPRTELTVMATSTAYAVAIPPVGAAVADDASIEVEQGSIVAVATVPSNVGIEISPGMHGTVKVGPVTTPVKVVEVEARGEDADARIELAAEAGELAATSSTLPPLLNLQIDVVTRDSILVPTIAVVSGGSGGSYVQRQNPDGSFTRVPVEESGQLGGQSAITITGSGKLRPGDHVKVG